MTLDPDSLPRFTFINGPNGSGKSTLAREIAKLSPEIMKISFADPMYNAMAATFYCEDFLAGGKNFKDQALKASPIPFPRTRKASLGGNEPREAREVTHREWLIWYGQEMKRLFGEDIWGLIALNTCELNEYYYKHFIFDDNRFHSEVLPFAKKFGPPSCLTLHLNRPGVSWSSTLNIGEECVANPGLHIFLSNDGTPADMLDKLEKELSLAKISN